ncbi:hypothetical protein UR09_04300 [Candidatus Nitromaritima sp. SCGC AAA799-A02]|nr:hypothetical protein UR09_04300 [Candidatus Nitromaritima sp. SCGC AAA799-A02]
MDLKNNLKLGKCDGSLKLHNGIGTLSLKLPEDTKIGDKLEFCTILNDPSKIDPFINNFSLNVKKPIKINKSKPKPRKPPDEEDGNDRDEPPGISFPKVTEIYENDWGETYDKFSALKVFFAAQKSEEGNKDEERSYDFFVNMDNIYLQKEMKYSRQDEKLLKARFKTGLVLIGLSLLHNEKNISKFLKGQSDHSDTNEDEISIEKLVGAICDATAMILLPSIETLGSTEDLENMFVAEGIGEAT